MTGALLDGFVGDLLYGVLWVGALLALVWLADRIRPHLPRLGRALRDEWLFVTYHLLVVAAWVFLLFRFTVPVLVVLVIAAFGQVLVIAQSAVRDRLIAELDSADRARRAAFDMARAARIRAKAVEQQLREAGIAPVTVGPTADPTLPDAPSAGFRPFRPFPH